MPQPNRSSLPVRTAPLRVLWTQDRAPGDRVRGTVTDLSQRVPGYLSAPLILPPIFWLPWQRLPYSRPPVCFVCIKGFSFLSVLSLFRFCSAWFALELGIPSPALIFQKYVGPSTQKMFTGKDCKILQRQEWGGFSEL